MKRVLLKSSTRAGLIAALSVSILTAGLAPASASLADNGDLSVTHETAPRSLAEVLGSPTTGSSSLGNEILMTAAGAAGSSVSIGLPGDVATPSSVDMSAVPDELIHGGDPLVSTVLTDASVTGFATEYGSQSIISIASSSAPQEYKFNLDLPEGAAAALNEDGSVRITGGDGRHLGLVDVPWAFDGAGDRVRTSFSLVGSDLVQTVLRDTSTIYPVHADPSIQWIPLPVLAVTGAEIRVFNTIQVALAAGGAWAGCTFSRLSGVLGKIVNQICTVVGVSGVIGVVNTVASVWGNSGVNGATCYGIPLYNPRGALTIMPARDCY